jgi:RHS repeat-associated protein
VTTTYIGNYFEWTGSTSTMKKYYYAGSIRVAMRTGSGTDTTGVNWLFGDHLGSQSVTTDASGSKIAEVRYKAWGEDRYVWGTTPTSYRYTGQRSEDYINLYWIGSRWYDPALSRWVQPDSIIPEAAQGVQAWDRYAYVNNSPVNFNDPTGHCLVLCTAIIGGAIGAIVGAVGYTAYAAATGTEFNTSHMLMAAGGGAVAGALIGTGVGIAAGMSAAATTAASVEAFGGLSQAENYGIQQGNQLKNALASTGLQVHHIIEQRFAPALEQSATQARQWLSAAVTPEEHQQFTNAWRSAIGYSNQAMEWTTKNANPEKIWQTAQDIYKNYPALLDAARTTIFGE